LAASVRDVSQPLLAMPSQLLEPGLQETITQADAEQ